MGVTYLSLMEEGLNNICWNLEEEKKYGLLFLQKLQENGSTSLGFGF